MSLQTLNENLDIIQNLVIPFLEDDLDNIQKLDDEPNDVGGLSAAELKAEFDKSGNTIKEYLNETLIPQLSDTVAEAEVRATAERERVANENIRIGNENIRIKNEDARQENEAARVRAETAKMEAEAARKNAESQRVTAENTRESQETTRKSNETDRESAESTRKTQESARQTAENARETKESARQSAENSRASAETARTNAEQTRASAETNRTNAEQTRASAETNRTNAENLRKAGEIDRINAENLRVDAEEARVVAEKIRDEAYQSRKVVQETGNSTTAVMSQAAVTKELRQLSSEKVDQATLTLGYHTDGLIYIFAGDTPLGNGIEMSAGGDVVGFVDSANNIVVKGNLADGTYSVKYEMEDGSTIDIGNLVLDTNVYYSVTKNLTQCTINNTATQVIQGESYSATITAKSGYELKSVTVTMGGAPVTVSGGTISIAEVTGDIVITAVAEEIVTAEPTNFFVVGGDGYLNPGRASSSGADRTDVTTCFLTNYIEVQNGDEVYAYGAHSSNGDVGIMALYKANKTGGVGFYVRSNPSQLTNISMSDEVDIFTINYVDAAYMRVCCLIPSDLSTIKVNIKRNGEWL